MFCVLRAHFEFLTIFFCGFVDDHDLNINLAETEMKCDLFKSEHKLREEMNRPTTPAYPVDTSRCYPISSLQRHQNRQSKFGSREALIKKANELMEKCCEQSARKGSLYCGGLGPHVYLRYQMAKVCNNEEQRLRLLIDAKKAAEYCYRSVVSPSSSSFRVSLLEGKQVGALCLLAAIDYQLGLSGTTQYSPSYIISLLEEHTYSLPSCECEVLYGRAGTIQAMLWLRQEWDDPTIGRDLVVKLAIEILEEGQKRRQRVDNNNTRVVSWEWHGQIYLGAAHGIVGILQTLLSLQQHDWTAIRQRIPTALQTIQAAINVLSPISTFCHTSGNLKSSLKKQECTDRLVHWCHGGPGLVLLWLQASKIFPNKAATYLESAQQVAEDVLWPRGLLKKGVGLCHGISGNGMVLNRLAIALDNDSSDNMKLKWQNRAFQYAQFALNHLDELEGIPDRPFSLFEGVGGLVCFLLQCASMLDGNETEESLTRFPLYEF